MTQRATIRLNNDDFELEFGGETFIITVNRDYWMPKDAYNEALIAHYEQHKRMSTEIGDLRTMVRERDAEITRLGILDEGRVKHIDSLDKKRSELCRFVDDKNVEIARLNRYTEQLKEEIVRLEKAYGENKALVDEVIRLNNEIDDLRAYISRIKSSIYVLAESAGYVIE